jgi:hypothetical protein
MQPVHVEKGASVLNGLMEVEITGATMSSLTGRLCGAAGEA